MKCVGFRIIGRVQGVGFRAFVQRSAEHFGVTGWVRNTPDGAVEGHAQGEPAAMAGFLDALQQGPPAARVDRAEVRESEPDSTSGFHVRRVPTGSR
jgi:acylphosphatase